MRPAIVVALEIIKNYRSHTFPEVKVFSVNTLQLQRVKEAFHADIRLLHACCHIDYGVSVRSVNPLNSTSPHDRCEQSHFPDAYAS